jgi:hypothetical protein
MAWYSTGSCAVTNGSPTVTGSGTAWAANIRQGWGFIGPDGKTYEVLAVVSDTSITLARNYAGSTLSGQQYDLFPTQGEINTLAAQVAALISSYSGVLTGAGAGKFSAGSAAAPGVSETTDTDTGLAWLAANVLALITGGVERLRVNSSGYLGQRVSAPQYYYDVRAINFGASQAAQGLALRGTSSADLTGAGWLGGLFMETNGSGQNSLSLYGPNVTTAGAVSMQKAVEVFGSGATQDVNIYAGGALLATFQNAGRVGIGTTAPATSLEIARTTGSASPTPAEVRVTTLSSGSDWSTALPWGRLSFYNSDASSAGPKIHAAIDTVAANTGGGASALSIKVDNTVGVLTEYFTLLPTGDAILFAPATPPALSTNRQMVFNLTSNTNLRISVRGTDGVTRVANLTLA